MCWCRRKGAKTTSTTTGGMRELSSYRVIPLSYRGTDAYRVTIVYLPVRSEFSWSSNANVHGFTYSSATEVEDIPVSGWSVGGGTRSSSCLCRQAGGVTTSAVWLLGSSSAADQHCSNISRPYTDDRAQRAYMSDSKACDSRQAKLLRVQNKTCSQ